MSPDDHAEFSAKVASGEIKLPSRSTVYKARTKLDWISMLYQQRLWTKAQSARERWYSQIGADASPQAGHEFLNVVEDAGAFTNLSPTLRARTLVLLSLGFFGRVGNDGCRCLGRGFSHLFGRPPDMYRSQARPSFVPTPLEKIVYTGAFSSQGHPGRTRFGCR